MSKSHRFVPASVFGWPLVERPGRRRLGGRLSALALVVLACVGGLVTQVLQAKPQALAKGQTVALARTAEAYALPSLTFKSSGVVPLQGKWLQFEGRFSAPSGQEGVPAVQPLAWQWGEQSGECQLADEPGSEPWRLGPAAPGGATLRCQGGHGWLDLAQSQADGRGISRWTGQIRLESGERFEVESLHLMAGQERLGVRGYVIRQGQVPVAEVELAAAGPVIRVGREGLADSARSPLWPALLNLALWVPPEQLVPGREAS